MRLEHVLSHAVRDAQTGAQMRLQTAALAVEAGRVTVSGVIVLDRSHQVFMQMEVVTLDGEVVDTSLIFDRLLLFNKPCGAVCEGQASSERSIFHWLTPAQQHPNISFFGRLDRDTTGLMILGEIAAAPAGAGPPATRLS